MKTIPSCFITLILFLSASLTGQQVDQKAIISGKFTPDKLQKILLEPSAWSPIPKPGPDWDNLPGSLKKAYMEAGEQSLKAEFPTLPAVLAMQFHRNGNRTRFEKVYWQKRKDLANLVMAECLERKGRFLDQIANGIWSIAEETWWVAPAHYYQYRQKALPDASIHYVDLYASETGILFAWTHYLLGKELDRLSPRLAERLLYEVDRRILTPCFEKDDFHWMGYQGQDLNNWTPWICSNWITCSLLCEKDPERRAAAIYKNMDIVDRFLEPYNADGGCDEGPGYWNRAGASLFDCLELLELASGGTIDVWDHPLVRNIGSYIYKVHIKDDYYVNFADASALVHPDAALVYRYGKKIGDPKMEHFASWLYQEDQGQYLLGERVGRSLPGLFSLNELEGILPEISYKGSWFPDLEVMVAREPGKDGNGFYLAAKGGFNAESHNHNDVGSFVVFYNGHPVLIDVGVETYTKKTFSPQRYEIWTMQSQYHNLPTINGQMQSPGKDFMAADVGYNSTSRRDRMSMDISGAYPGSAGIENWIRSLTLDKARGQVVVTDQFSLKETTEPVILNLMSHSKPVEKDGYILIPVADREESVIKLAYPTGFSASVETCSTEDPRLSRVWGEQVYRIRLKASKAVKAGKYEIRMSRNK